MVTTLVLNVIERKRVVTLSEVGLSRSIYDPRISVKTGPRVEREDVGVLGGGYSNNLRSLP